MDWFFNKPEHVDFKRRFINSQSSFARRMALFAVCYYLLFIFLDIYLSDNNTLILIKTRVFFTLLLLLCVLTCYLPPLRKHWQKIIALMVYLAGLGVIIMSSNVHEPFEPIYAQGLLLVIFYGYTMNKLLIKGGVIAGISITVSYAFYALFISEMQTQFLVTSLFFQISTNFFGVFSVYSMQKTAFFAYLKSERLQSHNKNLLKQSETDGLTGIGNRRFFNRRFEVLFKTKARGLDHISLVLGDIDLFKNYNDACGHLMGDEALKKVATMLAKNIDERTGFVARFGGEEFIMVLYNKNFEDTKAFIQSLQHQLFEQAINHPDSPVASYLTLSFGFVTLNLNNTSPNQAYQQLVRQADNCLYQAKSSGRNQSIGQRFN